MMQHLLTFVRRNGKCSINPACLAVRHGDQIFISAVKIEVRIYFPHPEIFEVMEISPSQIKPYAELVKKTRNITDLTPPVIGQLKNATVVLRVKEDADPGTYPYTVCSVETRDGDAGGSDGEIIIQT